MPDDAPPASTTTTDPAPATPPAAPPAPARPQRTPPAAAPPPAAAKPAKPKTVPGVQVTFLGPKDPQNLSRGEVKVAGLNWKPDHPTRTTRRWRLVDADGKPDERAASELQQLEGHTLGSLGLVKPDSAQFDKPAFKIEKVTLPAIDA